MLFKQTDCEAHCAERMLKSHRFPATAHVSQANCINEAAERHGKHKWTSSLTETMRLWGLLKWHNLIIYFSLQPVRRRPSARLVKPVSGRSPSPAGWPSPQTWWSSRVIPTGWWSASLCYSGWWGWRGARGPQGPEGGSCRTSRPACSDPATKCKEKQHTRWENQSVIKLNDKLLIKRQLR